MPSTEPGAAGVAVPVSPSELKTHYSQPEIVDLSRRQAAELGLWKSEERLITRHLPREASLLNAGCGAGRISAGLWEIGYTRVLGVDWARPMIEAARLLASKLGYATPFRVGDLSKLAFDPGVFDGVIWSANGIGDFPGPEPRLGALRELRRVTRSGGTLILAAPTGNDGETIGTELAVAGWEPIASASRSELADEPPEIATAFPDAYFWVARAAS